MTAASLSSQRKVNDSIMNQCNGPPTNYASNFFITGTIREKLEYSHADEAALSALFEEFGSQKFAYFESGRSGQAAVSGSLFCVLASLAIMLARL